MNDFQNLRLAAGLSGPEASQFLEVSFERVQAYENGSKTPSPKEIQALKGLSRISRRNPEGKSCESHIKLANNSPLRSTSRMTKRSMSRASTSTALIRTTGQAPELFPLPRATLGMRSTRALIGRLHKVLRDLDCHSNIIERFDELTKLLFLKLHSEERDSTRDLFDRRMSENSSTYAARIRDAYAKVAHEKAQIIPPAFRDLQANDEAVCECATILAGVSFRNVDFDVKGLAYEEVVKNTFDKTDNQQFFTPPSIVTFIVEMMRSDLKGAICDPAAGTGGFLVEILKSAVPHVSLAAFEIDERLSWVAGTNLLTHGAAHASVHWLPEGGTLGRDAEAFFEKYDAIITNPPFGSDFTDASLLPRYKLGAGRTSRRRGILFLERCHQLLKVGGCLGFIIDEGVLNLPSTEDVRRFITERFQIKAIVSLPEGAFLPYASVNASILILEKLGDKKRTAKGPRTFFAKAESVGRKGNGDEDYIYDESGAARLNSDFPQIVELYDYFLKHEQVPVSELAYSADVRTNLEEGEEDGWRLDFRYHHPSRRVSRALLARAKTKLLTLAEVCDERNQTLIPSTELQDTAILYTGLAHIESGTGVVRQIVTPANSLKSAVKRYEPGDIIFAKMRPNLRKVALMQFCEGGYVSPECIVFTVKKDAEGEPIVDPLLLSVLLRSDLVYGQIMHLIAGIGRPRLGAADLRKAQIPAADPMGQREWRRRYLDEMRAAGKLREKAMLLLKAAAEAERNAVQQVAQEFV